MKLPVRYLTKEDMLIGDLKTAVRKIWRDTKALAGERRTPLVSDQFWEGGLAEPFPWRTGLLVVGTAAVAIWLWRQK